MNPWKPIMLLSLAFVTAAWPADAGRYPSRQIDRPLIPPKHMWQEFLYQNTVIHIEDESTYVDEDLVAGFLPSLPSWSITDNLQWTFLPAPMFKYLITRNNINTQNGPVVKDFSMTVEGGISAMVFSNEGTDVQYQLGMSAKKPVLDWLWLEGTVQSYYHDQSLRSLATATGLGFQFTDRFYGTSIYTMTHMYEGGYRIYQTGAAALGVNFTQNLSLETKVSLLVGSRTTTLNPGAQLAFNW